MVRLYDKYGSFLRAFKSWDEANKFRVIKNRPDWIIK